MNTRSIVTLLFIAGLAEALAPTGALAQGQVERTNPPPASVLLAWDPVQETNVTEYNVYYGPAHGFYTNKISVPATQTQAKVVPLERGQAYFFTATAYDGVTRLESDYSNEVTYTAPIPPSAPTLRLSLHVVNGLVQLNWVGLPGTNYSVEASSDLSRWVEIAWARAGPEGESSFAEPVVDEGVRIYRLRL